MGPDCESSARTLLNMTPVKGLSGAAGAQHLYVIDVPVGATNLSFLTYGGTGDVSLYVRYSETPTTTTYDASSVPHCHPYPPTAWASLPSLR